MRAERIAEANVLIIALLDGWTRTERWSRAQPVLVSPLPLYRHHHPTAANNRLRREEEGSGTGTEWWVPGEIVVYCPMHGKVVVSLLL